MSETEITCRLLGDDAVRSILAALHEVGQTVTVTEIVRRVEMNGKAVETRVLVRRDLQENAPVALSIATLVGIADQFRSAAGGLSETTLSHRIFGDSKKLTALRGSADITVGRFNAAMRWMAENWPEGHERPEVLRAYANGPSAAGEPEEDAA